MADGTRFAGKVAVVTGAASGIGAATSMRLAREGARVVVADRDAAGADAVVAAIRSAGGEAVAFAADLADAAAPAAMIDRAVAAFGRVDVLHNNAGRGRFAALAETTLDDWQATLALDLTAPFLATRAVLPLMVAQSGGAIVNTASVAGLVAEDGLAAYCAAKAAVLSLTRSTAIEYGGRGVRANAVCPGTIATPPIARWPEARRATMARATPAGRLGTPDEIAALVCFLASDEARFVNGGVFVADGGALAGRGVSLREA